LEQRCRRRREVGGAVLADLQVEGEAEQKRVGAGDTAMRRPAEVADEAGSRLRGATTTGEDGGCGSVAAPSSRLRQRGSLDDIGLRR